MTQQQIKEQLKAGRLQLSLWETIEHYFFVVPTLFFPVFLLTIDESATGTVSSKMLVMGVGVLLLVAYFIFNRYKALEFDKYPIEHTPAHFQAAAKATAIALAWDIVELTDHILMAGKFDLGWQWDGLRITIISDKNCIYANSIVNPSMQSNPFSRGWNRKNLQVFKDNLIAAAKGEDVVKAAEEKAREKELQLENESEWTLRNTGKRIIGYFFALALLGVCGLILAEGFNLFGILIGGLCVGYLVLDGVMIVKKMNKK